MSKTISLFCLTSLFVACVGETNTPTDSGTTDSGTTPDVIVPPVDAPSEAACTQTTCGSECVDLKTSAAHCGKCGHACPSGYSCSDSHCGNEVLRAVAGSSNQCAILRGGELWCWGLNQYETLAIGHTGDETCVHGGKSYACRSKPVKIPITNVVAATGGHGFICAVKSDQTAWCWGANDQGQLGHSTPDGTCNDPYSGGTGKCNATPQQVQGLAGVVAISSSGVTTCATTQAGDVYCWGANGCGVLGTIGAASSTPKKVPSLPSKITATAIDATTGCPHAAAVASDGTAWTWGGDGFGAVNLGALGRSGSTAQCSTNYCDPNGAQVALAGVAEIGSTMAGSCARKTDGTVWCWGWNGAANLGTGSNDDSAHATPAQVSALGNTVVTVVSAGVAIATDTSGDAWVWGASGDAMLGTGALTASGTCSGTWGTWACEKTPIKAPLLKGMTITIAIATVAGLKSDGTVWTWGWNNFNQLGHAQGSADSLCNGTYCNPTPSQVSGLP